MADVSSDDPQAEAPEQTVEGPEAPEQVKEGDAPEEVKEEDAPEEVKEEDAPEEVKEEDAPEEVKEEDAPEEVKEEEAAHRQLVPDATVKEGLDLSRQGSGAPIDFVTLGMFIIDDIDFVPPTPSVKDILGGAGTYAALGARLFSPPPLASTVGWIVDQGSDFPDHLASLIDSWDTSVVYRKDPDRLTTRGWNGYDGTDGKRAFKYTTPKLRLTAEDLTGQLLHAKSFHLICSPARAQELVCEIVAMRKAADPDNYARPLFIWEPVPDLCTPDQLLNCTNTLPLVDICSPNHAELAGFMGDPDHGLDPETGEISAAAVERACEQLLASMPLQNFSVVVRAGEKGCYMARNGGRKRQKTSEAKQKRRKKVHGHHGGLRPDTDMEALFAGLMQDEDGLIAREEIEVDPGIETWIPAYHKDPARVVDPTGGGNTFLGGLGVALARGESLDVAVAWGAVAASFAIEQVGVPELSVDDEGNELWNGEKITDRLEEFKSRY